jgi:hypothetical protein
MKGNTMIDSTIQQAITDGYLSTTPAVARIPE